jgi:hypothetical protein
MHLPKFVFDLRHRLTSSVLALGALLLFNQPGLAQEAVSAPAPAPANDSANGEPSNTPASKSNTKKTVSDTADSSSSSTTNTQTTLVVRGEEVPSAYGAPPALSRSRFSNLVNAYVLPPYGFYTAAIFEGDAMRYNRPSFSYTAEVEMGLPYRFGVAMEDEVESFRDTTQERSFSLEMRYALADWDKIPLNPTLFAEYKFGIGHILFDEGPPEPMDKGEAEEFLNEHNPLPDSIEVRILLAETFGEVEWAFNAFCEQEVGGDRGREVGFAQSAMVPVILPHERLKVGAEMQLTDFTDKDSRSMNSYRFIIGPTAAWKPSANTRVDISPLIGATHDAPRVSVFAVFSYVFGGREESEAEGPTATQNR